MSAIVFLADSEPSDSPDYSAPGDPYNEASPELLHAFATGEPFVEGPFEDQWGEWVSGHAAIRDPETGAVRALIGIDIDAHVWRRQVGVYRWFGLGLSAVPILFAAYPKWRFQNQFEEAFFTLLSKLLPARTWAVIVADMVVMSVCC